MGIYKKIFQKITGKDKKPKTKNRRTMAKRKKLSPEAKAKIIAGIKKGAGTIVKYGSGKPKVKVTAKKPTPPAPTKKQPASNFWNDTIDMGIIKPTGKQLVIGGTATAVGGYLIYRAFR